MIDNDTELITLNSNDDDNFGAFKISEFGVALLSCYSFEAFFIQKHQQSRSKFAFLVTLLWNFF